MKKLLIIALLVLTVLTMCICGATDSLIEPIPTVNSTPIKFQLDSRETVEAKQTEAVPTSEVY